MKTSRILAIIIVMILTLTTMVPFSTLAADENATITITPPDALAIDASGFFAYKLFDVSVSGTNYAYTPVSAIGILLSTATGAVYGADTDAFRVALEAGNLNLKALTKDLAASGLFTANGMATKVGNNVAISGLDYGYYLVAGEGDTESAQVIAHSSLITVDKKHCTINLKADAPTIEKFVKNTEDNVDTWQKWTDLNIGDIADFELVSAVPNMSGYDVYEYIVHDVISNGLTLSDNFETAGVTITIGGIVFTDFVVNIADANNFKITFGESFITKTAGAAIEIFYSATLNSNAVIGAPGNPNEVKLEYSNNPYYDPDGYNDPDEPKTGETPKSEVVVYTFSVKIFKYTGELGNSPTALANAKFELKNSAGEVIIFTDNGSGEYTLATASDTLTTSKFVSPAGGTITIKGLDRGIYSLIEMAAPTGYHKIKDPISIEVIHTSTNGEWSIKAMDETVSDKTVSVYNGTGIKLPETGGIGTTIFYVVSALLTIGLVVFLVINKKKNILDIK